VSAAVEPSSVELGALLRRLHALCEDTRDLAQIDALRSRLKHGQLRVLVAGEAKRGKSTLINALLGRDVLPRGALPVTALATELLQGTPEGVHVQYRDGRRDRVPIRELRAFVAESQNPRNTKRVDRVTVQLDLGMPHPMLTLIDTPGVGSVLAHNTVEATSAYESMDAVVFVLTGDAPLSANELQLIRQVSSLAVRSYVVLNKADLIATRELDDVMRFLAERVTTATGDRTSIVACSATAALEARLSGDQDAWLASGVHTLHEELGGAPLTAITKAALVRSPRPVIPRRPARLFAPSRRSRSRAGLAGVRSDGLSGLPVADAPRVSDPGRDELLRHPEFTWPSPRLGSGRLGSVRHP